MYGLKMGWIVPAIVLFVLIAVIGVGIYQLNSDGNPWFFGEEPEYQWEFLRKPNFNDSAITNSIERQ